MVFSLECFIAVWLFYFFFSSRRRHTRSKRDWSSDVCSSDLTPVEVVHSQVRHAGGNLQDEPESGPPQPACSTRPHPCATGDRIRPGSPRRSKARSEERRVGKERKRQSVTTT